MAPLRRYLRITKYSVLEVRIYLDKPSDASWLLSTPRDSNSVPILRQILAAVRPYVLPKLREENEHARNKTAGGSRTKSKKKRGIKDVVTTEEFEATIFLTELSTRHTLLTKSKTFAEKKSSLKPTGKGLTSWLNSGKEEGDAIRIDEEDDEAVMDLNQIPEANPIDEERPSDDEPLFVSSSDEDFHQTQRARRARKRRRKDDDNTATGTESHDLVEETDDKKKLGLSTTFDGFSIYGRILCLVVKRRRKKAVPDTTCVGGSQMMEKWVSTQAVQESGLDEDEEG